jgi:PTS system nitrogen regulatory IIA component
MGVAIPHAKLPSYNQFFVALAVLQKPVEWHSLDGAPVRIVFMIGGPDDKQTEYLQILSALTRAIKEDETRKKLLSLQEPSAMIELFESV